MILRRIYKAALAAAALQIAFVAPASAFQQPAQQSDAKLTRAMHLTTLTDPQDALVELNLKGWEMGITKSLALNPAVAKMEKDYPGVTKAAVDAARPVARRYCDRFVERARQNKAGIIAQRLSPAEIEELITFFASPVGRRMIGRLFGNADFDRMTTTVAQGAAESGKVEVTADAIAQVRHATIRKTMQETSTADNIALLRFGQTATAKKFGPIVEESEQQVLQWVNTPEPAFLKEQDEALSAAVLAFIDKSVKG